MMGIVHLQAERLEEAETEVRRALESDDGAAKYHNTLGSILHRQGRLDEALAAFEAALAMDPGYATAAYNSGTLNLALGRLKEAEIAFRAGLEAGAGDALLFNNLAAVLSQQGRHLEAADCCREGLARHPDHPALGTSLASTLELANDLAAADGVARKVREASPDFAPARVIFARLLRRKGALADALESLEPVFQAALTSEETARACFELGLIQDAQGNYAEAFRSISRSNALERQSPRVARRNAERYFEEVRAYRKWIGQATRAAPRRNPDTSSVPVFFVGFPRSGTTLMEQMLKAHPEIVTTEEKSPLTPLRNLARKLAAELNQSFPACVDDWGDERLEEFRDLYWSRAEELLGTLQGRTLVDKLPLNIVPLGLVERLWPDARVLVALRDPRDVCLSCFFQRFIWNNAMVNFLDLERTGRLYAEVMALWLDYRERLTLPVLEYRYEDLVDDFEGTLRKVLDFIGVGWHAAISDYREAAKQRVIRTPSYRDVTAPIHDKAVQRWKNYEAELAPILPVLAPFVEAFGYET